MAYFGVPPAPADTLEGNITRKRQFWGRRSNGVAGRDLAERIKKDIQNLSLVILKGSDPDQIMVTDGDGRFEFISVATTVEELCEQLADLLRRGDAQGVQTACRRALGTWPEDPEVVTAVALSLSDLVIEGAALAEDGRALATRTADQAVASRPNDERAWLAKVRCTVAFGTLSETLDLESPVRAALQPVPAVLIGLFAAAHFRSGDSGAGLVRLIQAVTASNGDPAVRAAAAETVIAEGLLPLLPLQHAKAAAEFAEVADVAAWCADGVPEAEAAVLPFRLWAVTARNSTFVGDHGMKALVGVMTGFGALPLYNRIASRPGWRVLLDGPTHKKSWAGWCTVSEGEFVRQLHARAPRRFEWETSGQPWPTTQAVVSHMSQAG